MRLTLGGAVRIELQPYDPVWADLFERERRSLAEALGAQAMSIDHFGSTSVPGLDAKPIVDIMVGRSPEARFEEWSERLRPLGYVIAMDNSAQDPEGQWFFRDDAPRARHLHAYPAGTRGHRRHLVFRDALRQHAPLREEYRELKRTLAAREWATMQDYADAKNAFIRRVEKEAMLE